MPASGGSITPRDSTSRSVAPSLLPRISFEKGVDQMNDPRWIVAIVIVVVVLAFVGWMVMTRRRQERLRGQFGPEYPRAVRKYGSVARAESALEARRERVGRFDIRPLQLAEADRFAATWRTAQARFVD